MDGMAVTMWKIALNLILIPEEEKCLGILGNAKEISLSKIWLSCTLHCSRWRTLESEDDLNFVWMTLFVLFPQRTKTLVQKKHLLRISWDSYPSCPRDGTINQSKHCSEAGKKDQMTSKQPGFISQRHKALSLFSLLEACYVNKV